MASTFEASGDDAVRSRPLRLAMVVVGLAAVVYGAASLTGGWLGTPPWWENCVRVSTLLGAGSHYDEALAELPKSRPASPAQVASGFRVAWRRLASVSSPSAHGPEAVPCGWPQPSLASPQPSAALPA